MEEKNLSEEVECKYMLTSENREEHQEMRLKRHVEEGMENLQDHEVRSPW